MLALGQIAEGGGDIAAQPQLLAVLCLMRYDDWTLRRPDTVDFTGRGPGYRYLRAKGNSIEGGTSEILRNVVAERVLGLPPEHRVDKGIAWKDLPR